MLVLSRRPKEKIVFPAFNTSVEVLEVKPGRVRLGIDAPANVQILRDEVIGSENAKNAGAAQFQRLVNVSANAESESRLKKMRHDLRNRLNTASVGLALARRQLQAGMVGDVDTTLDRIAHSLQAFETDVENLTQPKKPAETKRQPEALLVEDDSNECELLAGFMRLAGYKVNTATDGEDALNRLRSGWKPDVMLLDMNMPRCDGVTTVKMIRRDPQLADLRIYAVTGYSAEQLGVDEKQSGLNGWFQKPLDPERLLGELQSA